MRVGQAELRGAAKERGLRRIVDHVVDRGGTGQRGEVNRRRVVGAESGAGGVDDDCVGGKVDRRRIRRKTTQRNAVRGGRDGGKESVEIGGGAIGDRERGAAALEALDGRATGGAPGAEKNHVSAGEVDAEIVAQAGSEAIAVGVMAQPAAVGPEERVDSADGAGGGDDVRDVLGRDDLVGNREIEPAETFGVKLGERLGEVGGVDLETEIAPGGKARIARGGRGQRGVVHRRADRVFDRLAEDGERGAVEGPGVEIAKGEDAGVFDVGFQIFD